MIKTTKNTNVINCVVRTYRCTVRPMGELEEKLNDGWIVKSSTPIIYNGSTECIEYILEKIEAVKDDTVIYKSNLEILFNSKSDAEAVLNKLLDMLDDYGFVSVAELLDFAGETSTFADNKYGWTKFNSAHLFPSFNGYKLILPKPERN